MANNVQNEGESLREFIEHFCNKRNVIPEVDDKSIIMFFKKGLRDPSLIHHQQVHPRRRRTLENKEAKKDKKLSQSDWHDTFKCNDKKRKHDRSVANVERPWCNNTMYQLELDEFEGFLDGIYIFHYQGKHKTWDWNWLKGFVDKVLKSTKKVEQDKKPKDPKGDFPEAQKEVNYIFGGPDSYK
jgi:hypothetical protein